MRDKLKRWMFLLLVWLGAASAALAEDRPEVSRYVKAYRGGDGVSVLILRVGPPSSHEALVQVSGIDHKFDQRILKTTVQPTTAGARYVAMLEGKEVPMLMFENDDVVLLAPVHAKLAYDKDLSAAVRPEHFLADFLGQK